MIVCICMKLKITLLEYFDNGNTCNERGMGGKRAIINIEAPDGNYVTVQVVSKGDGALSLKSMWKIEKTSWIQQEIS